MKEVPGEVAREKSESRKNIAVKQGCSRQQVFYFSSSCAILLRSDLAADMGMATVIYGEL